MASANSALTLRLSQGSEGLLPELPHSDLSTEESPFY